jgi:hypothetical protein
MGTGIGPIVQIQYLPDFIDSGLAALLDRRICAHRSEQIRGIGEDGGGDGVGRRDRGQNGS